MFDDDIKQIAISLHLNKLILVLNWFEKRVLRQTTIDNINYK